MSAGDTRGGVIDWSTPFEDTAGPAADLKSGGVP
jgi:hypothetical protein